MRARQGVPGKPAETSGTERRAATLPGSIKKPPRMFTSLEAECDALDLFKLATKRTVRAVQAYNSQQNIPTRFPSESEIHKTFDEKLRFNRLVHRTMQFTVNVNTLLV